MAENENPKSVDARSVQGRKENPLGPKWPWILGAVGVGFLLMAAVNKTIPAAKSTPPAEAAEHYDSASTPLPTDAWVGTWTGVEGLRLDISKTGASYRLHIANMDGEGDFTGVPDGKTIVFERAGKTERITAGDGAATGLKWLADQKNCLVIKSGEGFCRPAGNP